MQSGDNARITGQSENQEKKNVDPGKYYFPLEAKSLRLNAILSILGEPAK